MRVGSTRTFSACFICAPLSGSCLRLVRGRTNSTRAKSSSPLNTQGATARWCKNLSRGRHAVDTLYKMHSHTYICIYTYELSREALQKLLLLERFLHHLMHVAQNEHLSELEKNKLLINKARFFFFSCSIFYSFFIQIIINKKKEKQRAHAPPLITCE